jgi:hypothetical protein
MNLSHFKQCKRILFLRYFHFKFIDYQFITQHFLKKTLKNLVYILQRL